MATITRTYKVDDLDGTTEEGVETVQIALDGQAYEIDLGTANAERLRENLQRFVDAATPTKTKAAPAKRGAKPAAAMSNRDLVREIRRWADEVGLAVSSRGRLSADLVDKYNAAH